MTNELREAMLQRFEACLPPLALRDDVRGYTREPADNILPALVDDSLLDDFVAGDGGEMRGDLPSFCAAHSSAALAANSFGPYRFHPERLSLAGFDGFEAARFEKRLPAGLGGTPPHLDFFVAGPHGIVAVESKFTETFAGRAARFSPSWLRAVERLAEPAWERMYRSLLEQPRRFAYVNAGQLVKHYLGMRHSLAGDPRPKVLMYLYWEPVNADAVLESTRHRAEVASFAEAVTESDIRFVALSYEELWDDLIERDAWPGERLHVEALRARYRFPVLTAAN